MRIPAVAAVIAVTLLGGLAWAADALVSQKGKVFTPTELERPVGSTLTIPNDDDTPHNVTVLAPNGTQKNMGMQKPGEAASILLEQLGEYTVRCGIHPKMKLIVVAR